MTTADPRILHLPDAEATTRFGQHLASLLRPADLILLHGSIGAGKSHLTRAAIQALLAEEGRFEDVPSPTFTLVQSYDSARLGEVIHADLYRLSDPRDLDDIGLTDALGHSVCLIEWPDLVEVAADLPRLTLRLSPEGEGRQVSVSAIGWEDRLPALLNPPL